MSLFDDDLIENVKKYPILYRAKGKNYKNFLTKDNCWKKVATALNKTPEECKAKWRNIRDSYIKNQKKKITGTATFSKYDDERLSFLSEPYDHIDPLCNVDNSTSSSYNCDGVKEEYDSSEDVPLSETPFILEITENIIDPAQPDSYNATMTPTTYDQNNSTLATEQGLNNEEHNHLKPKKAMKRKVDAVIEELKRDREEKNLILQQLVSKATNSVESPTHTFFSSMADIVSKFPPEKIAETRMRVCNVVSEMELSVLRDGSTTPRFGVFSNDQLK